MTDAELRDPKVADMVAQVAKIEELRKTEREVKTLRDDIASQLEVAESHMLAMLNESGLNNFRCDHGLVSIMHRTSVKTPKSPEDREKFFAFLRERGLFDQMITVNSQTLNSFWKEQFEAAKERGEDDFKMPGINDETLTAILSYRKA